jgi:probable F420-dependent oxidoreductase
MIGITAAPFIRSGPQVALNLAQRAERFGYDSFWVAEVTGTEAFATLGAASTLTQQIALGTGVLPAEVRTPPLLAMAAASLQSLNPDREILLGIGVSSPTVAGDWHGTEYPTRPIAYMREFITLLRLCLSGEPVTFSGDYFQVRRFRLGVELGERRPRIVLGALGESMLKLGGEMADGVLLNYLPASHVPRSVTHIRRGGEATVYGNVHVGVGDRAVAAESARYDLFSYAVVDAYARHFTAAGFGDAVAAIRAAHQAGDRKAALEAVTDEMVDSIEVVGDGTLVAETVAAYRRSGVDVPVIFPLTWGSTDVHGFDATLEAAASVTSVQRRWT